MKCTPRSLVLFSVINMLVFTTCKKGAEDPAISLRTRKARVVGEWRMKSGNASITVVEQGSSPYNQAYQFDGSTAIINVTESGNVGYIYHAAYILNLKCKSDGTFEMNENYGGKNLIATGRWNFTGKMGGTKNKEELVFVVENISSGYLDGHLFNKISSEFTYKIIELRNKEMIIETGGSPFSWSNASYKVETHYLLVQ